jgi:ATP-binding cassette subfamily B protein
MIWKFTPGRLILTFVMELLSFAAWTFYTVFFMRYLFGSENDKSFTQIITFVWVVVGINLLYYFLRSWYNNIYLPRTDLRIQYSFNRILFDKAQSVDISCYETPEFYDLYTKANTEACDRAMSVLKTNATILSSALSSLYVIYIMGSITLWSLPIILLPVIGNLYFGKKLGKIRYDLNQECIPQKRKQDYVNRVVYLRKYVGEIRLTNIFHILKKTYDDAVENIVAKNRKVAKKIVLLSIPALLLQFPLAFQGLWFLAAFLAIQTKTISLADFIVLSSSIVSITWMTRSFGDSLVTFFQNSNYIENLKCFLAYTPKIDEYQTGIQPPLAIDVIEFRNVSFHYEGQTDYALRYINLTLKPGTKNAIVGINGSGKSTFIKLLMRLYDPTEGDIFLGGINIKEYDLKAYRDLIGVAFQDFAVFSASVLENIWMKEVESEEQRENSIRAAKRSGIYEKISTQYNGMDSILTKEFDDNGIELSGGEKQKLAIARVFAKKSPIVVLDEPSSALDPVAEYMMYENIISLCNEDLENKIAIIISHRLSSSLLCDHILLFENGYLIDSGSHQELMKLGGAYANMFHKQAENYLQEVGEYV